MDSTTMDRKQVREQLKTIARDQFLKASTKGELEFKAGLMGADITKAETKDDIYAAMIAVAKLPNPALRESSEIGGPVAYVWFRCDQLKSEGTLPRRKDMVDLLRSEGVAYYTARTQFQAWFAATDKGARRVADLSPDELPKVMRPQPVAAPVEQVKAPKKAKKSKIDSLVAASI